MKKIIFTLILGTAVFGAMAQSSITIERKNGEKIHTSLENFKEATFTDEDETQLPVDATVYDGLELEAQDKTNGCRYLPMEKISNHVWMASCRLEGQNWWDCQVKIVTPDHRSYWGMPSFTDECTESGMVTLAFKKAQGRYFLTGSYAFIFNDITCEMHFTRLYAQEDAVEKIVEVEVSPKSDFSVSVNAGDQTIAANYLGQGLWRATINVSQGDAFSISRTDKDGNTVVWGAAESDAGISSTGIIDENGNPLIFKTMYGTYVVLFDENNKTYALMSRDAVQLRTLSFEDADYKGEGNVYNTELPWSGLIDSPQWNGPMLYGNKAAEYKWYDQNNTELRWDGFNGPAFYSGGYAISNYVSEPNSAPAYQLAIPFGDGTNNFCVAFNRVDAYVGDSKTSPIYFADGKARVIRSIDVTNNSYAAGSLLYGDGFAPAAKEGNIRGLREDGTKAVVQHHLCKDKNILRDKWETVDCTELGPVKSIEIYVTGSDDLGGEYGLNTPGYAAFDNIVVEF